MVVVMVMRQVRGDAGEDEGMLAVVGSLVRAGIGRCWD